jgi:hypothetical protein
MPDKAKSVDPDFDRYFDRMTANVKSARRAWWRMTVFTLAQLVLWISIFCFLPKGANTAMVCLLGYMIAEVMVRRYSRRHDDALRDAARCSGGMEGMILGASNMLKLRTPPVGRPNRDAN